MNLFLFLLIGLFAGFIAGNFNPNGKLGLTGNLAVGIAGALAGGFLVTLIGFSFDGLIISVIVATLSAGAVLAGANYIDR